MNENETHEEDEIHRVAAEGLLEEFHEWLAVHYPNHYDTGDAEFEAIVEEWGASR